MANAKKRFLEVRDLQGWYGESHVLHGVNFHVDEGEVVTLLGRTGARLLLLDEISEGLAPVIVQKLAEMVVALRRQGYTVLMVEQNFRFAAPLADRFLVMEHGQVIQEFTQAELPQRLAQLHEYLGV